MSGIHWRASRAGRALASPISALALGCWVLNDAWWKPAFGNAFTGKVGDLASLYVMAFFGTWVLTAAGQSVWRRLRRPAVEPVVFGIVVVLLALLFAAINLSQAWNDTFTFFFWGPDALRGTADATDLYVLPVLALAALQFFALPAPGTDDALGQAADATGGTAKPGTATLHGVYGSTRRQVALVLMLMGCAFATIQTSPPPSRSNTGDLFLFLFSGDARDRMTPIAPANSATLQRGSTVEFRWLFEGYYVGRDPSLGNDPGRCAAARRYEPLLTVGGTYSGYRLRIAGSGSAVAGQSLSQDSASDAVAITLDLPAGDYYWSPRLVYRNASACPQSELEHIVSQVEGRFTVTE